jgi:hypothetical protein
MSPSCSRSERGSERVFLSAIARVGLASVAALARRPRGRFMTPKGFLAAGRLEESDLVAKDEVVGLQIAHAA